MSYQKYSLFFFIGSATLSLILASVFTISQFKTAKQAAVLSESTTAYTYSSPTPTINSYWNQFAGDVEIKACALALFGSEEKLYDFLASNFADNLARNIDKKFILDFCRLNGFIYSPNTTPTPIPTVGSTTTTNTSGSGGSTTPTTSTTTSISRSYFTNLNPAVADCWKNKIGESRYNAIKAGSGLTTTEFYFLKQCYSTLPSSQTGSPKPSTSTVQTTTSRSKTSSPSQSELTYSTVGQRFLDGSDQRDCVRKILGKDFDWFNNLANPGATREYQRFHDLENKVLNCLTADQLTFLEEPKFFMTPELIDCLKDAVGEDRFAQISSNKLRPSIDEKHKGEVCFAKFNDNERPKVKYQATAKLDNDTESCLQFSLGEDRFKQLATGQAIATSDEIAKGRDCFHPDSPLIPPPVLKVDTKIKECLENSVSLERTQQIKAGQVKPSQTEKVKASECFGQINPVQSIFLPSPPDQVPYLPIDNSKLTIKKAENNYQPESNGKQRPVVTFAGTGLPNRTVDLYLFSDPVVVTVNTDANGVWSYNLDVPLDPGQHIAYVAAKPNGNEAIRSEVFNFAIAEAQAAGNREPGLIVKTNSFQNQVNNYLLVAAAVFGVGIVGFVGVIIYLKRNKTTL